MEVDPDYSFEVLEEQEPDDTLSRHLEIDAREAVAEKIRKIIKKEFAQEISAKEREVSVVTDLLTETRQLLDRLRACVVASYYAASYTKPLETNKGAELGAAQHPAIQNVLRKAVTSVLIRNAPVDNTNSVDQAEVTAPDHGEECCARVNDKDERQIEEEPIEQDHQPTVKTSEPDAASPPRHETSAVNLGGRHRVKKMVVVGNVSKYIPPDKREGNDKSTHKWMVYVRGGKDEARIDRFVRKVWFFLHPSYRPNDLVEVTEAPFHLTRRGWGEFPIRVQLHFCDPRNRRLDIIHNLKLDRTYTGLQTLGAETVCEVELDRSTIGLAVDSLLKVPVMPSAASPVALPNQEQQMDASSEDDVTKARRQYDPTNEEAPDMEAKNTAGTLQTPSPAAETETSGDMHLTSATDMGVTTNDDNVTIVKTEATEGATPANDDVEDSTSEPVETAIVSSPDKKTRRRRGSSCHVPENSGDHEKKSLAHRLLETSGNDDWAEEETAEQDDMLKANSEPAPPSTTDPPHLKPDTESIMDDATTTDQTASTVSENIIFSCPQQPTSSSHIKRCLVLPPSVKPVSPTKEQSTVRPRSASEEFGTPVSQQSNSSSGLPGAVMLVRRNDAEGKSCLAKINVSGKSGQRLVVVRPRSKSATASASSPSEQSLLTPQTSSTLLKRVTVSSKHQAPDLLSVARKRSADISHVKALVPEKQAKLNLTSAGQESDGTSTSSPKPPAMTLIRGKLGQPIQAIPHTKQSIPTGHSSSEQQQRSPSTTKPPPKSFVLKNTKDGLVLVSNSTSLKDAARSSSPVASQTGTSKPTLKGLSQQQLLSLKALQSALLGAGVSLNRPVQVKVEKPSASQHKAAPSSSSSSSQFVLTTVTNEQGKQQIALVSSGRLQQMLKTSNSALKKGDFVAKPTSPSTSLAKQEALTSKVIATEGLALHEVIGNKMLRSNISSLTDDGLPIAAQAVPLVRNGGKVEGLPFVAQTEAEFLEWNVGKQRAAEWQRAALLHRILTYVRDKSCALRDPIVPSKRSIVRWCLMRGYSVFSDEFESADTEDEVPYSTRYSQLTTTLSSNETLVASSQLSKLEPRKRRIDEEVDVISVTPPRCPGVFVAGEKVPATPTERPICLQPTCEMLLVEEQARQVGVNFSPLPVTTGVTAPLCQVVLARALQLFCSDLKREALASAICRRDGKDKAQRVLPDSIKVEDVVEGVKEHKHLKMVGDDCMGV